MGRNNHYRVDGIHARYFFQTGSMAGIPKAVVKTAIEEVADTAKHAISKMESILPSNFPEEIHASVKAAVAIRLEELCLR